MSVSENFWKILEAAKHELVLISIATIPVALAVFSLGAVACSFSGSLTPACLRFAPLAYSLVLVAGFVIAFQLTHFLTEFFYFRSKNRDIPVSRQIRLTLNQTEKADISIWLESSVDWMEDKLEGFIDERKPEDEDEAHPVEITG